MGTRERTPIPINGKRSRRNKWNRPVGPLRVGGALSHRRHRLCRTYEMGPPFLSIFYVPSGDLMDVQGSMRGAWQMFPFVPPQALKVQQAKQKPNPVKAEQDLHDPNASLPPVRSGRFRRLLDAVIGSRRRQARISTDE